MIKNSIIILLFSFVSTYSFGQKEGFVKIIRALNLGHVDEIVSYAPDKKYGTLEFMTADTKDDEKGILKDVFEKKLMNFFAQNPVKSFTPLFLSLKENEQDPLLLGRLETTNHLTFYVFIVMVSIEEQDKFIVFHIKDKLSENWQWVE